MWGWSFPYLFCWLTLWIWGASYVVCWFMMTPSNGNIFCVTGPFVRGTTGDHKSPRCRTLLFSLICTWTSGSVKNRDAGDLRRHRTHYDVTAMWHTVINTLPALSPVPDWSATYFTSCLTLCQTEVSHDFHDVWHCVRPYSAEFAEQWARLSWPIHCLLVHPVSDWNSSVTSQQAHDSIITSWWRQNDVVSTS